MVSDPFCDGAEVEVSLHAATCRAGPAAAFNTIFCFGFVGNEGKSSIVFPIGAGFVRTGGRGVVLAVEVPVHGTPGRVAELKFIAPRRCVTDDVDGTGLEAATASILFHTLCEGAACLPFADDLIDKILDRWGAC